MMKVIIVEDEDNIREGLCTILDWESIGFEVPMLFPNAIEALHYLEKNIVDIVITDIYMPIINGLEFIEMIRGMGLRCEIIILTGHDEFEFAQKAMELNTKRYLLKPISAEKLKGVLEEVKIEIQQRIQVEDWIEVASKRLRDSAPVLKNQFWNDLISGRIKAEDEILKRAQNFEIQLPQKTMTCLALKVAEINENRISEELVLEEIVEEILDKKLLSVLSFENLKLVFLDGVMRQYEIEIIREAAVYNFGLQISMGISTQGLVSEAKRLADEAIEAVKSINNSNEQYYLHFLKSPGEGREKNPYPSTEERRIIDMVRFRDEFEEKEVDFFLEKVLPPANTLDEAQIIMLEMTGVLNRLARELDVDIKENIKRLMNSVQRVDDIEGEFKRVIRTIITKNQDSRERNKERLVNAVKKRIVEEFTNPELSVASLAEEFSITPNYLSRLFSATTKETCIEFLSKTRMRAAEDMLQNTQKKSYEIAADIGYKNANYFSALFKRYTGMSPKEFREKKE